MRTDLLFVLGAFVLAVAASRLIDYIRRRGEIGKQNRGSDTLDDDLVN